MLQKMRNKENIITNIKLICHPILVQQFYILSMTLLSLLLPSSFLVLARLSKAHYLTLFNSIKPCNTLLYSLFINTNLNLLHALVLLITLPTLIHSLTTKTSLLIHFSTRLHVAWVLLCTLQVCVGLGIEATIEANINKVGLLVHKRSMINLLVFFTGLHETMNYWSRTIVRPIVNDTVYGGGGPREEMWVEKWVMAMCFSALSWWRLRGEVGLLVVVVESKRELGLDVGLGDFIGLVLYSLTIVIGMTRIFKGFMCFCIKFFCVRLVVDDDQDYDNHLQIVIL